MVRKEWEREMGSSIGVWHLQGFVVTVLLQLCLFEAFSTYEHATDKIPFFTAAWCEVVHEVTEEVVKLDLILLTGILNGLKDSPSAPSAHFQASNVAPIPPLDQNSCLES